MKSSRLISFALSATLAAAVCAPFAAAHAANANMSTDAGVGAAIPTAEASATPCTITTTDLAVVDTAAAEGLLAELAARRALLTRTITCAVNDASALQNQVNGISLNNLPAGTATGAQTIQSQLSGKLGDAITYYNLELAKVSGAGIAGTQAIAKEVLAWRAANYAPLAANVENFGLWVTSQPLVSAANDRLNGIASLVAFFEEADQNNELQTDLSDAQSLIQSAKDENQAAENALLQSLPPDQVHDAIAATLGTLSAAYQKFFEISTAIKALLPSSPAAGK